MPKKTKTAKKNKKTPTVVAHFWGFATDLDSAESNRSNVVKAVRK